MARFKVGDHVRITEGAHGTRLAWAGAEGTIVAVKGQGVSGVRKQSDSADSEEWEQLYEVKLTGIRTPALVPESKLTTS